MRSILRLILVNSQSILVNSQSILVNSQSKLSKNSHKSQSNGRVNPKYCINQPGTLYLGCVLLPLGSPTGPSNRSYVHVPQVPYWCRHVAVRAGMVPGWVLGWVYRVGSREGIPGTQPHCSRREAQTAERAPEAP